MKALHHEEQSLLAIVVLSTLAYVTADGIDQASSPPNIILIVADDLGWDDVSFHGSKQIPTPNIDALAYTGVILNNYYVQPICTPTRSALLTGRHPIHTGLQQGVIRGSEPYGLGLNETLLSQYLKNISYSTHAVGKWHLGFYAKEYTPTFRGFDSHFGYLQGAEDYWNHNYRYNFEGKAYTGLDFHDGLNNIWDEDNHYSTEVFTQKAQYIIQEHNTSKPLFLYLAHQAVHSAEGGRAFLQAPEKYIKKFSHIKDKNRRIFAAMVSELDDSVGNVTKSLHDRGMLGNSIIIFTTDNGGPADGFNNNWACNLPLRGRKYTVWEGGTRGVGFIWSPLLKTSSIVSNQLMHVSDWLPTILAAVGYNTSRLPSDLDGMNMWDTINLPKVSSPRKELLYNIDPQTGSYAVRKGNYKLILEETSPEWCFCPGILKDVKPASYYMEATDEVEIQNNSLDNTEKVQRDSLESDLYAIFSKLGVTRKSSEPIIVKCGSKPANASTNCQPDKAPCLFDLSADPCEYNNIASSIPDIVKELQELLRAYNETAVPPKNVPGDPKGLPMYHNNSWVPWIELN